MAGNWPFRFFDLGKAEGLIPPFMAALLYDDISNHRRRRATAVAFPAAAALAIIVLPKSHGVTLWAWDRWPRATSSWTVADPRQDPHRRMQAGPAAAWVL